MTTIKSLEQSRRALQAALDGEKTQAERNRLGQFATPPDLAREVLEYGAALLSGRERIRFLDPALGTGVFFSALRQTVPRKRIAEALGFEIDAHYGRPAAKLWKKAGLTVTAGDFTGARLKSRFNLLICNPPYVRHHHLRNAEKERLQKRTLEASGMKMSGLAGLYCHFLGLSHAWMAENGVAGWLIPSEFMDVNYGGAIKRYLLSQVTLLHIHRFDPNDVQFADALVSSAVVWFRKTAPPSGHVVTFSFGGTLQAPHRVRTVPAEALSHEAKWTRFPASEVRQHGFAPTVGDFFRIKRGLATGDNHYFILDRETIDARRLPLEVFRPILPSPRYLPDDQVEADDDENPLIERRLFLLDTHLSEVEIERQFPTLRAYLEEGKAGGLHKRYLCSHRSPWYAQEDRPAPPIVCTYLGRGDTKRERPFRFILNKSRATVANVYLAMYPKPALLRAAEDEPDLIERAWAALQKISSAHLLGEGRVYGGGLHKLEPRELGNVPVPQLAELLPIGNRPTRQAELFAGVGGSA